MIITMHALGVYNNFQQISMQAYQYLTLSMQAWEFMTLSMQAWEYITLSIQVGEYRMPLNIVIIVSMTLVLQTCQLVYKKWAEY